MTTELKFPMSNERVLRVGDTYIGVIPEYGGLVSHFQVGDWPVLYRPRETGNLKRWGIPLMIPNFARLKDGFFREKGTTLPTHGFGRDRPWAVTVEDATSLRMQLTSSAETRVVYPYDFIFTATITVGVGTLTYTLTIENQSDEVMPIAPGFHPYFTVAQEDKVRIVTAGPADFLPATAQWETQPPDNAYVFPQRVTIQVPRYGTLTIAELPWEGHYSLATMQIWSEPPSAPDHNFVCFEPVVASADGLNRPEDRLNIAPHATHTLSWQIVAQPRSK
jgi:galactose mutarotase-like enzyme